MSFTVANLGWKLTCIFQETVLKLFCKGWLGRKVKCLHFSCLSSLFDWLLSVVWIWLSVLTTRSIGIWKLLPLVHWAVTYNRLKIMTTTMKCWVPHTAVVLNLPGTKQSFLALILLIQIRLTYFEFYFPLI